MNYRAMCPVCGRLLMKAAPNSDIYIDCPKCEQYLNIKVEENGVHVIAYKLEKRDKKLSVTNFEKL